MSGMTQENELEPVGLIRQSGAVLALGRLSLSGGTGSYRVKATMARAARALGMDRHEAHVTLTEITATSHRGPIFRTEVTEMRKVGVNSDRLMEIERFVSALPAGATVEQVEEGVARIQAKATLYGPWLNALFAAVACAAFAFLNNGGPVECAGVFVAAGLGQLLRRALLHRGMNQFAVTMLAAALASALYLGIMTTLLATGATAVNHEAAYVSAVLFLVPGFPLVTGALDLARLDFSAGVARLAYALMILMSAALAVWGVSALVGVAPDPAVAPDLSFALLTVLRLVASFLGVLGFALMFNSPWAMAVTAASVGMVANVVRLTLVGEGLAPQAGAAIAALLVGVVAAWAAPRIDVPRVTVYVPAVVIMVPGAAAYRAVYHLNNGATVQAMAYAVEAGLVVVALAIGLAVGRMLTDRSWLVER